MEKILEKIHSQHELIQSGLDTFITDDRNRAL
jgi:hypothetical protein